MFTLRFQRQGKKKDFVFRVVATDSHFAVNSGKAKEILGWWDPRRDTFNLKKERILYWLQQGAQPSDSCYNLLVRAKIIEGKKRVIKIKPRKKKKGTAEEKPAVKTEQPAEATKKEEKTEPETKPETRTEEKTNEEKPGEKEEEVKEKPEEKEEKESSKS